MLGEVAGQVDILCLTHMIYSTPTWMASFIIGMSDYFQMWPRGTVLYAYGSLHTWMAWHKIDRTGG